MPKTHWTGIVNKAAVRNIPVELTPEEAVELFTGACALSGVPIAFSSRYDKRGTASLDRIDSTRPYTKDNVQWVHKDLNKMKQDLDEGDFVDWCRKVAEHHCS